MPATIINLEPNAVLEKYQDREKIPTAEVLTIAAIEKGMDSGRPSVAFFLEATDGSNKVVVGETSLRLFLAAADAFKARFGDPRDPP